MSVTTANTSTVFCCPECSADVALNLSYGDELYYECQNPKCRKCVHVDVPEALALKETELVIGSLDGEPVIASHMSADYLNSDETRPQQGVIGWVEVTWMDEKVSTDGRTAINLPASDTGMCDDLSFDTYAWLKEAMGANVIDRLVKLAHAYVDRPWPVASEVV